MKGGARSRSGPAPDPNALRREREGEWLLLPARGRVGDTPPWPLSKATVRERAMWEQMWARPQAVEWERQSQQVEVAMYVRRLVEAEQRGSAVNLSTLVRQMADSLGLTTPGLRSNRWKIEDPEVASDEPAADRQSARDRLSVVPGGV